MNTNLDCLPCVFRQTLDAVRRVSDDSAICERAVREVAGWIRTADLNLPPPVFTQRLHVLLYKLTGVADPYKAAKARDNELALSLLPQLRDQLQVSSDPLLLAVRIAITGNLIDLGAKSDLGMNEILLAFRQIEEQPFSGDIEAFRNASERAQNILYLADNAGEIVVDRLLIERLGPSKITVAVRGGPIINDATMKDAHAAGLDEIVRVISNGSNAPGTVLEDCSEEFRRQFERADMVISKGQGNFETLSENAREIFFLFKVKCHVIASKTGLPAGRQVLLHAHAGRVPL